MHLEVWEEICISICINWLSSISGLARHLSLKFPWNAATPSTAGIPAASFCPEYNALKILWRREQVYNIEKANIYRGEFMDRPLYISPDVLTFLYSMDLYGGGG